MRIIKSKQDIVILRRAEVLPAVLLVQVEDYFNQLSVELEVEAESQFRLGENGYIVLLEAGDNVRDLGNVGLAPKEVDYWQVTLSTSKHWTWETAKRHTKSL